MGTIRDRVVYVIPSFRSEQLRFGRLTFVSGGQPSLWDRDVDDALMLVRAVASLAPQKVDAGRVLTMGFSRGAGVALLMGARDPGVQATITISGPTDFLGVYVRDLFETVLKGNAPNLTGLGYLNDNFLQPWAVGRLLTDAFRLELVRRSAVLFSESLPRLQLHHGQADAIVHISQAESLMAAMRLVGRTAPDFEAFLYSAGGHSLNSLESAPSRAGAFIRSLWF